MQSKHTILTYAYHFLSESIILFLLMLPIFHFYYIDVETPYWTYLVVVVFMSLVFSFFTKKTNMYGIYILTAPICIGLFYLAGLPIVMSVLMSGLLIWRYLDIRRDTGLNRETTYLKWAVSITLILILIVKDIEIVIYALLLFLILMAGYIISHLVVVEKEKRKQFNHSLWGIIIGSFIIGTIGILFAFDFVRFLIVKVWELIRFLMLALIEFVASIILPLFDFKLDPPENELEMDGQVGGEFQDLIEGVSPGDHGDLMTYMYWALIAIIVGLLIFIVIRFFRRKFEVVSEEQNADQITYYELDVDLSHQNKRSLFERLKDRAQKRTMHPARKMVYQFEKKLAKREFGRRPYETIEEWLRRIQMDVDIYVYQKVRYGEQDVTQKELESLENDIKEMERKLEEEL